MKGKKLLLSSLVLVTTSIGVAALSLSSSNITINAKASHSSDCVWNHYSLVAPSYESKGCKEYWVCCSHHEIVFVEPSIGTITNAGYPTAEFINSLTDSDSRTIPSYKAQVDDLIQRINALPDDATFTELRELNYISNTYNSFNSTIQSYVSNYSVFEMKRNEWKATYTNVLDAYSLSFTNREYTSSTFTEDKTTTDEEIGNTITISDVSARDTFWIAPSVSIGLSEYTKINFYVRASENVNLQFRAKYDYNMKLLIECKANEWTLCTIDLATYDITDINQIGIAKWNGGTSTFTIPTIEISSFYGTNKNPAIGRKIFDASFETFTNNIYSANITTSHITDSDKGNVLMCSNMSNTSDGLWLKPNKNLGISSYKYIYFYFKTSIDIGIEIRETTTYNISKIVQMKAGIWTKIVLDVNETNFSNLNLSDLGLDNWGTHTEATAGTWYISDIYGVEKDDLSDREFVDGVYIPLISSDENIDFTAYGIPSSTNDTIANTVYSDAKEAGFTKAIGLYDGRNNTCQEAFQTALQNYLSLRTTTRKNTLLDAIDNMCETIESSNQEKINRAYQHGVGYYALNDILYDFPSFCGSKSYKTSDYQLVVDEILSKSEYFKMDNYYGEYYWDEPSVSDTFENQKYFINAYKQISNGEPMINLLPCGEDYSVSSYQTYINNYFNQIYPLLNYVSFDQYPVHNSGVATSHLLNLELYAQKIKAYGSGELRTFIYSSKSTNNEISVVDSADDLRFQIYANLAFGSTDIAYFSYANNEYSTDYTNGLVNLANYSHSETFDYAKTVNNEVHNFERAFRNFSWGGIMYSGSCNQFSRIQNALSSYGKVSSVSGTTNTLVGCFKDNSNNNGFLVMNYQNPNETTNRDAITLTFNDGSDYLLVYKNGTKHLTPINNHQASIDLDVGGGAFVIPVKSL